jgi:SAM-dependent methyltransferase
VPWFRRALARYQNPWAYFLDSVKYMEPVFGRIRTLAPPPCRLIELGCGIGMAAAILSGYGYDVVGVDDDQSVLWLAASMPWQRCSLRSLLHHGDVRQGFGGWNVATSLGVIEHEDHAMRRVMLERLREAGRVHVVCWPSPFGLAHDEPTMGERTLYLQEVRDECQSVGWTVIEAFGFGGPLPSSAPWSHCIIGGR